MVHLSLQETTHVIDCIITGQRPPLPLCSITKAEVFGDLVLMCSNTQLDDTQAELLEADGIIEIPDTDLILIDDSTDEYSDANAMRQTTPPPSPRTIKQELSIKRERSCSLSSSNKRVRYDSEGYSEIMRALRKMEQEIAQVKRQNSALAQENRRLKRQNGSVDEPIVLDD